MKRALLRGAALALLIAGPGRYPVAHAQSTDPLEAVERVQRAMFERVAPSVVFLSTDQGFGSGFFVDENGLVLTNAHVVGKAKQVKAVLQDGRELVGEVVRRAPDDLDLALVRLPLKGTRKLPFGEVQALGIGSWVASVGHGSGAVWAFNVGMVSNIYPPASGRNVFQTQIPLNPGSSGGPVLDRHGQVVGVVSAGLVESNSINFAIRADIALRAFSELRGSGLRIRAPKGVAVFVDGKHVGEGPELVLSIASGSHGIMAVIGGRMVRYTVDVGLTRSVVLE